MHDQPFPRLAILILILVILAASGIGIALYHPPLSYDQCVRLHHPHCTPPPVFG